MAKNRQIVYFIMVDLADCGKVVINYRKLGEDLFKVILLLYLFGWRKDILDGMLMVDYKHNIIQNSFRKGNCIARFNGLCLLIWRRVKIGLIGRLENETFKCGWIFGLFIIIY